MEVVSNRLQAGLSWLSSSSSGFLNSTLFDSLSIPFTDSASSISSIRQPSDSLSDAQAAGHVIYVDRTGQQISEEEFDSLNRGNFGDSPWGFVASRYALTLGIMAVVVNRISHICRPQGRPRPLSAPRRLAIQLPTMAFLTWSGLMLLMVTLHSFSKSTSLLNKIDGISWLPSDVHTLIDANANESDIHAANSALLWRLFLSVCLAVVSSTLLRTLEGHNTLVNPDDLGNSPTFNLVGFAVLLHLHASSYTFPPNKHVYLSILFQVGEVLGLQACTCWATPPVSRLTLTSIFGLTSTLHYLHAIRSGDRGYPFLQGFSRAPDLGLIAIILLTLSLHAFTAIITSTPLSFARLVDPRSLPLPTDDYSLALFKLGTACLSSTRLSGLDSDLIDVNTSRSTWLEVSEGQVRVGIKDSTGRLFRSVGLDNEIKTIKSNKVRKSRHPLSSYRWQERFKFVITFFRTIRGLMQLFGRKILALLPFDLPRIHFPRWMQKIPRLIRLAWHGSNGEERRRMRLEEERRRRDWQEQVRASQAMRNRTELAGRDVGNSTSRSDLYTATYTSASLLKNRGRGRSPALQDAPPNSWQRYFQQDFKEESDDEDGDWCEDEEEVEELNEIDSNLHHKTSTNLPTEKNEYWNQLGSGSRLIGDDDEEEDEDDGDGEWQDEVEPGDMSAELLTLARREFEDVEGTISTEGVRAKRHESYPRILMAHMTNDDSRILTRRGYRDLIGGFASTDDSNEDIRILADVIQQRRTGNNVSSRSSSTERERMRLCVICYAEDRTIICWPCKCLALCDGCREAMAARPPPRNHHRHPNAPGIGFFGNGEGEPGGNLMSTHTCPTCRTPVIGFSRVFLP